MIVLIGLTAFAMLVLLLGFLEIKIPFVSAKKDSKQHAISTSKHPIKIEDNLVKNFTTRIQKQRLPESALITGHEN